MSNEWFQFRQFTVWQDRCAMKVGTDGVLLGAWARGGRRVLDIGTGTGLIALMMAQRYPHSTVEAIDIEHDACGQAQANVAASPFAGRVSVSEVAVQQFGSEEPFDSIVSNPPYFMGSLRHPDLKRSMARHTDTLMHRDLCRSAYRLLADEGEMSVVLPVEAVGPFLSDAIITGFYVRKKYLVKTVSGKSPKRCLLALVRHRPAHLDEQTVTMFNQDGNMTEWYADLTGSFYL